MHVILEALLLNLLIVYYILEGIVLFFIPSRRKDVKGQKVLITGAGMFGLSILPFVNNIMISQVSDV